MYHSWIPKTTAVLHLKQSSLAISICNFTGALRTFKQDIFGEGALTHFLPSSFLYPVFSLSFILLLPNNVFWPGQPLPNYFITWKACGFYHYFFNYMKGGLARWGLAYSPRKTSDRMRRQGLKLCQGRFRLYTRRNFFHRKDD